MICTKILMKPTERITNRATKILTGLPTYDLISLGYILYHRLFDSTLCNIDFQQINSLPLFSIYHCCERIHWPAFIHSFILLESFLYSWGSLKWAWLHHWIIIFLSMTDGNTDWPTNWHMSSDSNSSTTTKLSPFGQIIP